MFKTCFCGTYSLIVSVRYKIDYITSEKAFLFSVNFSACFETGGDCMLNFPIMTHTKIPLLDCNFMNQTFAIPGSFQFKVDSNFDYVDDKKL